MTKTNIIQVFQSYLKVITGNWLSYNLIFFMLVTTCPRHRSHFIRFVTRVTRRVSLVDQELPTLPEHLSLPLVFSVARYWVFCVGFCRSLFVLSFFFWPLCCLSSFDLRILITPLVSSNSENPERGISYLYRTNQLLNSLQNGTWLRIHTRCELQKHHAIALKEQQIHRSSCLWPLARQPFIITSIIS